MEKIICGDCIEEMKKLPENSVDSICCDPPYGLGFMGKKWDTYDPTVNKGSFKIGTGTHPQGYVAIDKPAFQNFTYQWAKECLRVLKPGGHLLSFGGTRTYHRMACAIEDAGFEIRDMIEWCYGSGFPKSLNIGKAVDKLQGNERDIVGHSPNARPNYNEENINSLKIDNSKIELTKGTSEWEGYGTSLKPSHEPICMARKPLSEKTVALNCLKWGTGGLNIDGCRVSIEGKDDRNAGHRTKTFGKNSEVKSGGEGSPDYIPSKQGRFPANLIHDNSEEVRECFPDVGGGKYKFTGKRNSVGTLRAMNKGNLTRHSPDNYGDSGNASRFFKSIFYCPKASKSERNKGCEGLEEKIQNNEATQSRTFNDRCLTCKKKFVGSDNTICHCPPELKITDKTVYTNKNNHPTVKPIALMEYLIKMVTPKGGVVLDPFAGSGSTLVAAKQNGYQYIGIEMTEEYIPIIEARLNNVQDKLL